jgi:hypothetical protein
MTMLPEQRKQRVILLSRADAARVRGISRPGHALDPRQISEDQFILGLDVLEDPTHAIHISFLSTLPHCDIIGGDAKSLRVAGRNRDGREALSYQSRCLKLQSL